MNKIPDILEALMKALAKLENTMNNSSVSDRPEVQAAKDKLMNAIRQEMTSTADLAMSSRLAYPLLKQLQSALPVSFPLPEKDEDDEL
jgi:hypothetical protein